VFDVSSEDGIDSVFDGDVDGLVVVLGGSGRCQDYHVKVKEKPPKGRRVNHVCRCNGDGA
jgi:hypothetical protein